MTRNRYVCLLLKLKAPSFTRNMDTYLLRDLMLELAVENEVMADILKTKILMAEDRSTSDFQELYDRYICAAAPWVGFERVQKRHALMDEFKAYKEAKENA